MATITLNGLVYVLNDGSDGKGQSASIGTLMEQDIVPSYVQATEGAAGSTDTQPTAEIVYRSMTGSIGLYKRASAPGDFTRCFVTDADTTRANQITAWLSFGAAGTAPVDTAGGHAPQYVIALVDDPTNPGFTGWCFPGGVANAYWRWNGTKFAFQRTTISNGPSIPAAGRLTALGGNYYYPFTTVPASDTSLWCPMGQSNGCSDISVTAAVGVGVVNAYHAFVYLDILYVISLLNGTLSVTPYRPRVPAAANQLLEATYGVNNNQPAVGTMTGEVTCLGVATCEGAVYICTDRNLWMMQWNDINNTFLLSKVWTYPRITSAPVSWRGSVYFGADNQLIMVTPRQGQPQVILPDALGTLPVPLSGTITQIMPMAEALYLQVNNFSGGANSGRAILRYDPSGSWAVFYLSTTETFQPMVPTVDGTNGQLIGLVATNGAASSTATMLPAPAAGRNPRTLATAQRTQRAGPFRTIFAWETGASEVSQKVLQRIRIAVQDTLTQAIKVYYQTDDAELSAATFTTGAAAQTGAWTLCAVATASAAGSGGSSIDANGNGTLWIEWDGTTSWGGGVGVLPQYPRYKQIRFMVELNGDTTGATVPTFLSLAFHRVEFVTKSFQSQLTLRIQAGELGINGTAIYESSADVVAAHDNLKALAASKAIAAYVDERGVARNVILTKLSQTYQRMTPDGLPSGYLTAVTLQDLILTGLN